MSIETTTTVGSVRILMRNYFSTQFLWGAKSNAEKAKAIEDAHVGESRFDYDHRACVLNAVTSSAMFMEAAVSELFQDAADGHSKTYLASLPPDTLRLMASWWRFGGERAEALAKYQMLLVFADRDQFKHGAQPFQDAQALITLRNFLVHYKSETVAADVEHEHKLWKTLKQKRFADNRLMAGAGNAWWPDHALGAGCAWWAYGAAKTFVDDAMGRLEVVANYQALQIAWP